MSLSSYSKTYLRSFLDSDVTKAGPFRPESRSANPSNCYLFSSSGGRNLLFVVTFRLVIDNFLLLFLCYHKIHEQLIILHVNVLDVGFVD